MSTNSDTIRNRPNIRFRSADLAPGIAAPALLGWVLTSGHLPTYSTSPGSSTIAAELMQ